MDIYYKRLGYNDHYYGWYATIVFYFPDQLPGFSEYPSAPYLPDTCAKVVSFDWQKKVINLEFQVGDMKLDKARVIFNQFVEECAQEISEKTGYEVVIS